MKSRISFFSIGILLNDLKSMGWIGALYLLGLLLSIPLQILMIYSRRETMVFNMLNNPYLRIFQFETGLTIVLLLVVPVVTGLLLFRYLHYSPTVDTMHSLPVKRETLYNSHLTAGIIFLFVPLIITALVSWLTINSLAIDYVSVNAVWDWLWVSLLFSLLLYMTCAAVGMFCGMYSVQAAITYIILFLPTMFSGLLLENIKLYVFGFASNFYVTSINNLSPLVRLTEFSRHPFTAAEVFIYLLSCMLLFLAGRYLYKHRPLEAAGNAITFSAIRPVFKYGVTFCSMLAVGNYFNNVQQSMTWTYFGYVLGSLLGYLFSEILLNYSFHVFRWRMARGYLGFVLVMAVFISGLNFDLFGFEKRQPELSQIESVFWDQSFILLNANKQIVQASYAEPGDESFKREINREFLQPGNINNIYNLQQAIIANREQEKAGMNIRNNSRQNVCIRYKLSNGSTVYRQYRVNIDSYRNELKPIYESLEYKTMVNDVLHISPDDADVVEINANAAGRQVRLTNPALIRQAVTILQSDIKNESYEDMTANKPGWANISILLSNDKRVRLEWRKSFTGFGNWLKEIGEYKNARIIAADDIDYAIIAKSSNDDPEMLPEKYAARDVQQYLVDLQKQGSYIKLTDSKQIEACLNSYTYTGSQYQITFVLKNSNSFTGGLDESCLPDAAREYFNSSNM